MPQSLLEGYMAGKRYLQEREEKEEEQKREKLANQIRELEFKRLTRGLERSAEEWERQKKAYQQKEEAISGFDPEEQQRIRAGLRLTEKKEPTLPWFIGTEYEKPYVRKQTYIKSEKPTLPTDWLKAPGKQESAVQKWLGDWEEYIFTPMKEFAKAEIGEIRTFEDLSETERRAHFNKWIKRVPAGLRSEVRERAGMDVSTKALEGLDLSSFGKGAVPEISLPGQPTATEETFHGAGSYDEVVEAVANIPEPKRSEILEEAKAFFGIE